MRCTSLFWDQRIVILVPDANVSRVRAQRVDSRAERCCTVGSARQGCSSTSCHRSFESGSLGLTGPRDTTETLSNEYKVP